MQMAIVTALFE